MNDKTVFCSVYGELMRFRGNRVFFCKKCQIPMHVKKVTTSTVEKCTWICLKCPSCKKPEYDLDVLKFYWAMEPGIGDNIIETARLRKV